jgi:hypothetical protein
MALEIVEAKDIKAEKLTWLFYGRPRAGKTTLIGTFPQPICITNFKNENGAKTVRGHSGVTTVNIKQASDLDGYINWVFQQQEERPKAGLAPFKTVAVDSLTSYVEMLRMEHIQNGGTTKMPGILPYYAEWANKVITLIERLRGLDAEVVYTATASLNKDELDGSTHGGPDMFKSLEQRVPAKVDAVIFMESDTVKNAEGVAVPQRLAWLTPHNGMIAGVRGYVGKPCVEAPNYAKLMAEMGAALFD